MDVQNHEATPSSDPTETSGPTVVGIGASAGGLLALKSFFAKIPPDSGLAFVVVVHLSPDHESHLADILQTSAKIPVDQVTETVPLEENRVYLIPPNANLDAIDTHLRLSKLEESPRARAPVDHFFRTLAEAHDGNSIGIILSGTGSDGALGIKAIKEKGGLAVVQAPTDAEFDGMPQSAIATGVIDLVLPVASIPEAVIRYARTRPRMPDSDDEAGAADRTSPLLHKIFAQVRARTGRDFTRYKRSTILRRISRRMQLHQVEELAAYLELLRAHPGEIFELADDLLITVTSFFRDPAVFEKLERKIIPKIFANRIADKDDIRVWVVGCATGEEPYSLAMLLLEEARRHRAPPRIQVFASDLHEHSLERARQGFYPAEIETDVGPERLRRFFTKEDGGYRIHKDVREIVLFAPHNLLSDPPFSRIDLISCRNLLIYLHRDAQEDVDGLFHYALRPDGYLVLGGSELATRSDLFAGEGKKSGVYRRRDVPTPESRLPVFLWWRNQNRGQEVTRITGVPQAYGRLHQRLVEQFAPPSVLVGPDDKVVHLSEHAGRYLVHPGGEVTSSVFKLVREELSIDLHAAVSEARRGRSTRSRPIQVRFNGQTRPVVLNVRPCSDPLETGFVLVIFDEVDVDQGSETEGDDRTPRTVGHDIRQRELETELDLLKQKLQAVIEEYDTSQEEMRAANEELQSANEELRSTMEELETGKEELHSMNEELQTVNQENRHKVEELSQLSGDLANLLASTDIATLFLDKELRIMRFTPKVAELFNMRVTDRGRLLSDLTHRLGYQELASDAGAVLGQLIPIQREVRDDAGRWYLARVLPYRSSTDRIEGVVITFVDVTATKQVEEELRRTEERASAELEGMVQLHDLVGRLLVCADLDTALAEVLQASIAITHAEMGTVHLLDKQRALQVTAQRGFERSFQGYHRSAPDSDDFPWIRALDVGARVVIEDVESDPSDPGHRALAAMAGYRGVHSIPLVSRAGGKLGVLSTYHAQPHRPSERDLRILDLYARQATEFIEQVRTKEALNEKTRQLQEEDDRKGMFLATLGHELRNPLSVLFNSMQLVAQGTPEPKLHPMISGQIEHLKRLVDDLLDVARITRGTLQLQKRPTDLTAIVRAAAQAVATSVGERQRDLVLSVDGSLPVQADEARLQQVVVNLLHNAFKFSPEGSRVELSLQRDDGEAIISVRDEGRGIEREDLRPIFDPFAQARPGDGGLGIGLAVVKRLVEMHGGSVVAESEGALRGSTFTVRLPIGDVDGAKSPTDQVDAPLSFPTGTRVLIVEDGRDTADSLALLLRMHGAEVRCAYSGREGIDQAVSWKPHVALIDIGLPDMAGYEVAQRIREQRGSRTLLLAVTGFNDPKSMSQAGDAGFAEWLVKPIEPRELHGLVLNHLETSQPGPKKTRE